MMLHMKSKKPLRVLYIDTAVGLAGGQHGLIEILRHLDPREVEPVLGAPRGSRLEAFGAESGIERVDIPFESGHVIVGSEGSTPGARAGMGAAGTGAAFRGVAALAGAARRLGIDLMHANTFRAGLVAGVAARLAARPMIFHDRTLFGHLPAGYALWTLAKRVIVISRAVGAKYPRLWAGKLRLIPDMVDTDAFRPRPGQERPGEPVVGYLVRLDPEKGLVHLVRAAPRVLDRVPGARFRVAGEAFTPAGREYVEEVRREIDTLGLAGRFDFMGRVEDAPGFLAGVSVLALPSEAEGSGTAVLEAMAMERPVVAFDTGGQREIISDGRDGRLVSALDAEALGDALAGLLANPGEAALMGRMGREKVVERYSSGPVTAEICRLYAEVAPR